MGNSQSDLAEKFNNSPKPIAFYDPAGQDILTEILFLEGATIPAIRIVRILLNKKRKPLSGARAISVMIGYSLGSTVTAINFLIEHGFIERQGKYIKLASVEVLESDQNCDQSTQSDQKTDHLAPKVIGKLITSDQKTDQSDQNSDHKYIYKNNLNNNLNKEQQNTPFKAHFLDIQDTITLSTGKKPLVKYPNVYLTESELETLLAKCEESNFTHADRQMLLNQVEANNNQKPSNIKIKSFSALVGWAFTEVLKQKSESQRLKNLENPSYKTGFTTDQRSGKLPEFKAPMFDEPRIDSTKAKDLLKSLVQATKKV